MRAAPREWVDLVGPALERRFGFSFAAANAQLLDAAVAEVCSSGDQARKLATTIEVSPVGHALLRRFLEQVLIGETYFLRIPEQFEALAEHAVRLHQERGQLEVWSCGCATGEEPYSLAMALLDLLGPGANVKVSATDLHPGFLETAARARYAARAVRLLPAKWRTAYLEAHGDLVQPSAPVRAWVRFQPWNLLDGPFGGQTFDVVFCRNVLIYMSAAGFARGAQALRAAVRPGGLLFLGAADAMGPLAGFRVLERRGAILFERLSDHAGEAADAGLRPVQPRRPPARAEARPVPLSPEPDALAQARTLQQHGHLREARAVLQKLCAGAGAPLEGLTRLAQLLADEGDASEARAVCERALIKDPTDVVSNHLLALLCEESGEWEHAEQLLRRAICADPEFAVGQVSLGALYRKMGQSRLAQKHLELAATLLKGRRPGEVLRGAHHTSAGWLNHAIETLLKDLARAVPA